MAKLLSNSLPSSWIHSQGGCIKAVVDISPDIFFKSLADITAGLLGVSLLPTDRFEEFPAVVGHVADHEVVVFGLPGEDDDLPGPDWVPKYQITIDPDYPEGHALEYLPPRDLSAALKELLAPFLPGCRLSIG